MIEAIWNALDFWQKVGVFILIANIPIGIVLHIENCGGWTLYWAEKRREKRLKKDGEANVHYR